MPAQLITETATFAGGCFWCMEPPFEKLDGIISVTSGYSGGKEESPTYEQVASGKTSHVEAIQIVFDPNKVSYNQLLEVFWRQIDPTDPGGQFADRGAQYQTVIFYHDHKQRIMAGKTKKALEDSSLFNKSITTRIQPFTVFYPAEDYHQDFHKKNPVHYKNYRKGSGRQDFIENVWEPFNKSAIKRLTPMQYRVTQQNNTEPPFNNEYWDNHQAGIYVDVVSGEPLFSSIDKFDSGCGWPSFTRPLDKANIAMKPDTTNGMIRTEVRSKQAGSHLGHLFNDGPLPTGMRYCINSAALRFIPKQDLKKEGYPEYLTLFSKYRTPDS